MAEREGVKNYHNMRSPEITKKPSENNDVGNQPRCRPGLNQNVKLLYKPDRKGFNQNLKRLQSKPEKDSIKT